MLFIVIMYITTFSVAMAAAYFSVYGLAHTFSGAFWSVVFMGGSVEAGKLVLLSFLYRFRNDITWRLKIPAVAITLAIMFLTSLGIYGYLSAAYQTDTLGMKQIAASSELKKVELGKLEARKTEIDKQISQLPTNDVRGRQKLQSQFKVESTNIDSRIQTLTAEIQQLTEKQLSVESHVGPIVFIAKAMGADPDSATNILIMLVIFVFDPLAILLTILTNVAIQKRKQELIDNTNLNTPPQPIVSLNNQDHVQDNTKDEEPPNSIQNPIQSVTNLEALQQIEALSIPDDNFDVLYDVPNNNDVNTSINQFPPVYDDLIPSKTEDNELSDSIIVKDMNDSYMHQISTAMNGATTQLDEEVEHDRSMEQLNALYDSVASKTEQTATDKETINLIDKFYERNRIVRNVRNKKQ